MDKGKRSTTRNCCSRSGRTPLKCHSVLLVSVSSTVSARMLPKSDIAPVAQPTQRNYKCVCQKPFSYNEMTAFGACAGLSTFGHA